MKNQIRYEMLAAGQRVGKLLKTFPSPATLKRAGADTIRAGDPDVPHSFTVVSVKNP